MRLWVLALLFTLSTSTMGQGLSKESFVEYESAKKDKAVATAWWLVFPGGSTAYAVPKWSFAFIAPGAVSAAMLLNKSSKDDTAGLILLIVTKVVELPVAFAAVDRHNAELRDRLGLALDSGSGSVRVRLTISI